MVERLRRGYVKDGEDGNSLKIINIKALRRIEIKIRKK
jgi:hypothetical protein